MQYVLVVFRDWLLGPNMMFRSPSTLWHALALHSFLGPNDIVTRIYHILFMYQLMGIWVFPLLATMNNAAINIYAQFLCRHVFISLVELLGHMVTVYNCFRNCQTVFQSDGTILYSHRRHRRFRLLCILAHTGCYWLFDSSLPSGWEVVSHCGFDLHFPAA